MGSDFTAVWQVHTNRVVSGIGNASSRRAPTYLLTNRRMNIVLTEYQLDQLVEVAHKDCCWGAPHLPRSYWLNPPKWPWGVSADDPPAGQKIKKSSQMYTFPLCDKYQTLLNYTLPTDQTIHNRILLKVCCNVFTCGIRKSAVLIFWVFSKLIHNRIVLFVTLCSDILVSKKWHVDKCCHLTFRRHRENSNVTLCFCF